MTEINYVIWMKKNMDLTRCCREGKTFPLHSYVLGLSLRSKPTENRLTEEKHAHFT